MEKSEDSTPLEPRDAILISYSAGDPEHPEWFIYENESHRKVLVEVSSDTGKVHFLKEL